MMNRSEGVTLCAVISGLTMLFALAGFIPGSRTVDLSHPGDLRVIGSKSLDHLGHALAVGDFNNDGHADLAIGANDSDPNGNVSGEVYVLFGNPVVRGNMDMADRPPDVDIWGATDEGRLGHNMTVADLNGDGIDDLIVLDYNAGPPDRRTAGASYVFLGGTPLWNQPLIDMRSAAPDVTIWGAVDGEHAGSIYAIADLNTDGIDDLLLGAPLSNRNADRTSNTGAVYVVYGRADLAGVVDLATGADITIRGGQSNGFLGSGVAVADLDGDAAHDLVVGVKGLDRGDVLDTGAVFIISNVAQRGAVIDLRDQAPDLVLWGSAGERAGSALAVGDVNGDGQVDLLIGAPSASPGGRHRAGLAYLVYGPLSPEPSERDLPSAAAVTIWGPHANARAGEAVALWDLGGDRLAEVMVNVPQADVLDRSKAGLLAIFHGRSSFDVPMVDLALDQPDVSVWGAEPYTRSTWYVHGTRDLDENGLPDLLIGLHDTRPADRNGAGTVYGVFNLVAHQATVVASPTATPLPTPTGTAVPILSPTLTPGPTDTATAPASPTVSPTLSQTPIPPSLTFTVAPIPSPTPSATSSPTVELLPTQTQTATLPVPTSTATHIPAPTATATPGPSVIPSPTATRTATPGTPAATATHTLSPQASLTSSPTATMTATGTATTPAMVPAIFIPLIARR